MANETAWIHFREITGLIKRLKDSIEQIIKDIDRLKVMKEEILDNAKLKTELKKIIDIYPGMTMESLIDVYNYYQALKNWFDENNI